MASSTNWDERYDGGYGFGQDAWGASDSGGWVSRPWESKPIELKDAEGNPLSLSDAEEELSLIEGKRLDLDSLVKGLTTDPADQADEMYLRSLDLEDRESDLLKYVRQLRREERDRLEDLGVRDFAMDDDDDNRAITRIVDEQAEMYETELQKLKERVSANIRENLATMREDGKPVSVATRDKVYESLVDKEVIETWEPLEL